MPEDIELGNHFTSTSPETHFTRSRVVSLPRADGRVSLADFSLTEIRGDETTTRSVAPGEPYMQTLAEVFGLELDADDEDLRPVENEQG